jgi:sterol desaturase/sphingolipid hydroxylase (fatty acid hydroxylase superfamily)
LHSPFKSKRRHEGSILQRENQSNSTVQFINRIGKMQQEGNVSNWFKVGFLLVFTFYNTMNGLLYLYYYQLHQKSTENWKIQPKRIHNLFSNSNHKFFGPVNIFIASLFAGTVMHLVMNNSTLVYWNTADEIFANGFCSVAYFLTVSLVGPTITQGFLEYWWHRMMHLPWFYSTFHKIHHHYKSPQRKQYERFS